MTMIQETAVDMLGNWTQFNELNRHTDKKTNKVPTEDNWKSHRTVNAHKDSKITSFPGSC